MRLLEAVSIGAAIPTRGFDAVVHSVFSSAANLKPVKISRLLTLLAGEEADLPQGIRLNTPKDFSFKGLRAGERVTCQDGILRFEHTGLVVDLRLARRYRCDLPALAADIDDPSTAAAWLSVQELVNEQRVDTGLDLTDWEITESRRLAEREQELVEATRLRNLTAAVDAAAALIGLGSGLTPAGDDFLVGYLAGLCCAAGEIQERTRFLSGMRKEITRLSRRTNDISRTYLYHAAHGQVSSRLADLAKAICRGESSGPLLRAAEAAIQVGHSSGLASVTGLLRGIAAWQPSDTPGGGGNKNEQCSF